MSAIVKEVGLESEEIKWQKVNEYTEERYKKIIDVLFELLGEGKAKIRIFFRHRQFEPVGLSNEQRRKNIRNYTISLLRTTLDWCSVIPKVRVSE